MMKVGHIAIVILFFLSLPAGDRSIHIEFPNGGEVLKSGSQVEILWRSLGVSGNLAILLFKSGEQYAVIADAAPNSGSFQWKVSAALPASGQYRLRICALTDLRINDFSDRDFAITK
jgi:hypothetical protein